MSCGLERVVALGFSLGVPWGDTELTTGSLVRRVDGACDGVMVEVVSVNPVYARGKPPATGTGCIDPARLGPVSQLVALADRGRYKAGDIVTLASCDDLDILRPIGDELAAVDAVREAYARHFGPIGRHRVPWTDWGYVGLPMDFWTADRRDEEARVERLDTPARREKAAIADGPGYYHFAGADPPDTDRYGNPAAIIALLDLAAGWFPACTARHTASQCAIGIGDIAWFNPERPDPLGHKDHWAGKCVDIRLFRSDGSRYEAYWNRPDDRTGKSAYDPALTKEFVDFARAHAPVGTVYFDDAAVVEPMPGKSRKKHPDHIHMCFDRDD